MRAWIRLPTPEDFGVYVVEMGDIDLVTRSLSTAVFDGELEVDSLYGAGDTTRVTLPGWQAGNWVCLEQHVRANVPDGLLEVFVDEVLVHRVETATATLGALAYVGVGVNNVLSTSPNATVLIDDVAISATRIGCR